MKFTTQLLVSLGLFLFTASAVAQTCGEYKLPARTYKYCVTQGEGAARQNVLWYFHGIFEDEEKLWSKKEINKIQEVWKAKGISSPTIIAISLGSRWLVKENITFGRTSIASEITSQILPRLEKSFAGEVRTRMVLGKSMGGFNAFQTVLRSKVRVDKAAFVCPAFFPIGPHSTFKEVDAYKKRHKPYLNNLYVDYVHSWTKKEFPNLNDYSLHHPYLRVLDLPRNMPVYLSVGQQDDFGFNEGTDYMAEALANANRPVVYEPLEGKHCAYDVDALAAFLDFR